MKQYMDALEYILKNGKDRSDRTNTGTKSVFGYQMRFDLRESFPAVTTKKLAWRAVVSELLWFLEGSTDERRLAEIHYGKPREELVGKTTIWTANADRQGKELGYVNTDKIKLLGPVYGYNWTRWPSTTEGQLTKVKTAHYIEKTATIALDTPKDDANDDFIGKVIHNKFNTEYLVIEKTTTSPNSIYKIQCTQTGHHEYVTRPNLKSKSFGQKIIFNKGYSTVKKDTDIPYYTKAYNMWYNMMARCYNREHPQWQCYGGSGVFVCQEWHDFGKFLIDLESIPFFYDWLDGTTSKKNAYELDKDYYSTNMYSKNTCIFLKSIENKAYSNKEKDFTECYRVTFPDKTTFDFLFVNEFIEKYASYNFNAESIRLCGLGKQTLHRRCIFEKVSAGDGYVFRKKRVNNQIAQVLEGLHYDPYGRRHIVSAWNADQVPVMALPPCHTLFQFHVQDGELSCQLYQRSVDAPLGLPFNIASYSLLTHMFAQLLNLKVGEFIHTSGDLHIYQNQIEGITEQLKRDPLPGPTLEMPEFSNLDELIKTTPSQYKLINYQHHPEIKMPFAV
jgi:thymidylate synthase